MSDRAAFEAWENINLFRSPNHWDAFQAGWQAREPELEALRTALKKANDQAEHFEREWYLRGDELEALRQSDIESQKAYAQEWSDTLHEYTTANNALRERVKELEQSLLDVARLVEGLKQPCSMDPESPQAIRNGTYMSIGLIARTAIGEQS